MKDGERRLVWEKWNSEDGEWFVDSEDLKEGLNQINEYVLEIAFAWEDGNYNNIGAYVSNITELIKEMNKWHQK